MWRDISAGNGADVRNMPNWCPIHIVFALDVYCIAAHRAVFDMFSVRFRYVFDMSSISNRCPIYSFVFLYGISTADFCLSGDCMVPVHGN